MALGGALGSGLGARDAAPFCVAGVAQPTSTFVARGRRGTNSHLPSFRVAGMALMALGGALGSGLGARDAWHFAWQWWHKLASNFVLRGGTI